MSGGSFNYLYGKDAEEIYNEALLDDFEKMLDVLLSEYDSPNRREIHSKLRGAYDLMITAKKLIGSADILMQDYKDVMKAIEWHTSYDIGKDRVEEIINGIQ
jgi:lipoate-protein ligase A